MYVDEDGILWIGTFGGGLNRFDPRTEKFARTLAFTLTQMLATPVKREAAAGMQADIVPVDIQEFINRRAREGRQ